MAGRPPKKLVSSETSASIAEQTRAFLEAGGQIEQIKKGSSGKKDDAGTRHIVINTNPRS